MFIFKNISSEDMGLVVQELPPISSFDERINKIVIPGRDGELTEVEGYQSQDKTVIAHYEGNNPDKLLTWLRGSGEVILGNIKDRYYKARISNKIPLEQVIRNKVYKFPIIFDCQPFGYLLEGKECLNLIKPTKLYNHGTYKAKPIITVYGSGPVTITINNKAFSITNIYGGVITINSEIEEVYEGKGRYMEGKFSILDVGKNIISWTGNITKLDIIPNWRCIV